MKRYLLFAGVIALAVQLAGCAVTAVHRGNTLSASARWAQLPIQNYSNTPQAGERAGSILTTLLNQRGISKLSAVAAGGGNSSITDLGQGAGYKRALTRARSRGYRYGVTGSVTEWHYKTGLNGEPAVGVTLRVVDVVSGETLWSASGSRGGWGYSTVSGIAQKLMSDLVDDMPVRR